MAYPVLAADPYSWPFDGRFESANTALVIIDKPGKGSFYATDLQLILQNHRIENLVVCGATTEVCVHTTMREANDRGFRCTVPGDCCASYYPEFHAVALRRVKAQDGIFGWVTDSTRLMQALR